MTFNKISCFPSKLTSSRLDIASNISTQKIHTYLKFVSARITHSIMTYYLLCSTAILETKQNNRHELSIIITKFTWTGSTRKQAYSTARKTISLRPIGDVAFCLPATRLVDARTVTKITSHYKTTEEVDDLYKVKYIHFWQVVTKLLHEFFLWTHPNVTFSFLSFMFLTGEYFPMTSSCARSSYFFVWSFVCLLIFR